MPRPYLPPMKPIPSGASEDERKKMYREYKAELIRLNPGHFNADGSIRTLWQDIKELLRIQ